MFAGVYVALSLCLVFFGILRESCPKLGRRFLSRVRSLFRRPRGPWIQTRSGARWYLCSPRPEDVVIQDLGACAYINRWGGHAGTCTLAEHQVRVAETLQAWGCDAETQLQGALHDAHEVYPPGDVAGPVFKAPLWISWSFRWMSRRAERAVRARLGMPEHFDPIVRHADLLSLSAEAHDRLPGGPQGWASALPAPPPNYAGWAWEPEYAALRWWTLVAELAGRVASKISTRDPRRAAVLRQLAQVADREAARVARYEGVE